MVKNDQNSKIVQPFQKFAKGVAKATNLSKKAVVYTRVSTKEQAENNNSLFTQKKAIIEFAQKNEFEIIEAFGGTYESAKSDGRKEFQKMLNFIKKNKTKITHILVYSLDRFSRTGGEAIQIAKKLSDEGVEIIAVTQITDTTTPSGKFQQNINFIFSNYDNELRKSKCVAGMKDALIEGKWVGGYPIGYEKQTINGVSKIVINEKGKLIRNAFNWKAQNELSNVEIHKKLLKYGLMVSRQQLSKIFTNVFYCGYITHNLLEGKVVKGLHEPLISEELFKKVNGIVEQNASGWKHKAAQEDIPLKIFLKCCDCGSILTGYKASNRNTYYYKCRKGCRLNVSAEKLNTLFHSILNKISVNPLYTKLLRKMLMDELSVETSEAIKSAQIIASKLTSKRKELDEFECKFYVKGDVSKEVFNKYSVIMTKEIESLESELVLLQKSSSNIEKEVDKVLEFVLNLSNTWVSSDYHKKQKLQKLIFPDGLVYSKKNEVVRTDNFNTLFLWIARQQKDIEGDKNGIQELDLSYARLVDPERFELSSK